MTFLEWERPSLSFRCNTSALLPKVHDACAHDSYKPKTRSACGFRALVSPDCCNVGKVDPPGLGPLVDPVEADPDPAEDSPDPVDDDPDPVDVFPGEAAGPDVAGLAVYAVTPTNCSKALGAFAHDYYKPKTRSALEYPPLGQFNCCGVLSMLSYVQDRLAVS